MLFPPLCRGQEKYHNELPRKQDSENERSHLKRGWRQPKEVGKDVSENRGRQREDDVRSDLLFRYPASSIPQDNHALTTIHSFRQSPSARHLRPDNVLGEAIKGSPANDVLSGDDGERSPPVVNHLEETRSPRVARGRNPSGDGESGNAKHLGILAAEAPLRFVEIAERFRNNTRLRFKPGATTPRYYLHSFERLWNHAKLEGKTRRQIAGKRGRDAILRFMETVPVKSRRTLLAALECVWVEGLEAPWPINRRRDFGKTLPSIGTRDTPPDGDVRPWAEAAWKEPDPFVKLLTLLILQFGWRPENQVGHLRWRNVRYTDEGQPYAIVAKGDVEAFKSSSGIIAKLPPDVVDALEDWKRLCDIVSPDAPILAKAPRGANVAKPLDGDRIRRILDAFERRWGLKHLAPALFRHWVKTTCRRLSDPALAALQGHAPPKDGSMRNVYDTPSIERILDEQATEFPHGALGVFRPVTVSLAPEYQAELHAIADWKAGRLNLFELMGRLESLHRKQLETVAAKA